MFSLARHCLKWAGKPRILSPLVCARYGWINVGCDMLKCSSCQAFLCASLQPTLDFKKCEQNFSTTEQTLYLYQGQADVVSLPEKKKVRSSKTLPLSLIDESRIAEIARQLQTQHEKFCPWPDFPCPGWTVLYCMCILGGKWSSPLLSPFNQPLTASYVIE